MCVHGPACVCVCVHMCVCMHACMWCVHACVSAHERGRQGEILCERGSSVCVCERERQTDKDKLVDGHRTAEEKKFLSSSFFFFFDDR